METATEWRATMEQLADWVGKTYSADVHNVESPDEIHKLAERVWNEDVTANDDVRIWVAASAGSSNETKCIEAIAEAITTYRCKPVLSDSSD